VKKLLVLILIAILLLSACSTGENDDGVIVITERFFVTQTLEIFGNSSRYIGSTIRLEGIFLTTTPFAGDERHFVIRNTYGCCSPTELIGFELYLGDDFTPLQTDAWVEVAGILERYTDHRNFEFLRLEVVSLTEKNERGAEFVSQ